MSTGFTGEHNRGFNFLPRSIARRPNAQQTVDALFNDRKNVLIKLQKKDDRTEAFTLIEPHPDYFIYLLFSIGTLAKVYMIYPSLLG